MSDFLAGQTFQTCSMVSINYLIRPHFITFKKKNCYYGPTLVCSVASLTKVESDGSRKVLIFGKGG